MAAHQTIPADFKRSYEQCDAYPQNLMYKTCYKGVLRAYEKRVETTEPPFLTHEPTEVKLHFRDWDEQNNCFVNHVIESEDALRYHLGEHNRVDPSTAKLLWNLSPKKDPKTRFVFLYASLSTKPLKITPRMLKRLLTYHQVMPAFVDFLSVFAHPPEKRELGFTGFFEQTTLSARPAGATASSRTMQQATANMRQHLMPSTSNSQGPAVAPLGRSGRQYQMCYNLKRVARYKGDARDELTKQEWAVQQNEFHHQFDVVDGRALWVSAKGRLADYRNEVLDLTGGATGKPDELSFETRDDCFKSSLIVHLLNCHWASSDWRGYVNYLEDVVEEQTGNINVGPWVNKDFTPASLQAVQASEEKANNAVMIIDTNIEVMGALRDFYAKLLLNKEFDLKDSCSEACLAFIQQINDMIHAFEGHKRRARVLVNITENRKNLLLQKLQSHATKKMEDLTTMSYREAVVMKVITVGTFVFLPATFVSTFFSTDVIKYQGSTDGNGAFSRVALNRWLQVTIPLTIVTLLAGFIAFYIADKRRKKRMPTSFDGEK